MGNREFQPRIGEHGSYRVDIVFERGYASDGEHKIECIIDTGYTAALALPETYESDFLRSSGDVAIRGSGAGTAKQYTAKINEVNGYQLNHPCACTCNLPRYYEYGLLGLDFLTYSNICLHGVPDSKDMTVDMLYAKTS